ncbi:Crp/Fnr family transcriptional regulator [Methylophilus sp. OH31]|uniref:Crp/Fnr family transcriptional regulator n=1 Tax=Methylophilus sp. OH31 TaxID=1387312 RepID=UPI0004678934|nr:Crp/Fnr family transcriptional regulator [Methylophilus sp. OH31]
MKHALHHNRLIGQTDRHCHDQLLKHGDWVELLPSQQLNRPEVPIEYAYFPTGSVIALVMQQQNDKPIALALIGNEGMIGIAPALGVHFEPYTATVLSSGAALRISVRHLYTLKTKNKSFSQVLDAYIAVINAQFAQAAICHGLHDLQQRLACLLLTHSDRISRTNFTMTQALLANLLGVRRSGINKAASTLQQAQILHYSRGQMHILNSLALLEKACQCYVINKHSYQSILHF